MGDKVGRDKWVYRIVGTFHMVQISVDGLATTKIRTAKSLNTNTLSPYIGYMILAAAI